MDAANKIATYSIIVGIVFLSFYPHFKDGYRQSYGDGRQGGTDAGVPASGGATSPIGNVDNGSAALGSEPASKPVDEPEPDINSEYFQAIEDEIKANAIRAYYKQYNCPLAEYAEIFVEVANENKLDWRLLPAIGQKESSGGKRLVGNNPFGYGYLTFRDFEHAIRYVGSAIAGRNPQQQYYHEGMTVYEILWKYNGTVESGYPARVMHIMNLIGEEVELWKSKKQTRDTL